MYGAIIGDICGSIYENRPIKTKNFKLIDDICYITDDTICTVAVAKALLEANNDYSNLADITINNFVSYFNEYPHIGFGGKFFVWACNPNRKPYGSFGNGAAMRISAVGWLAETIEECDKLSDIITNTTHNHPESLKGARCVSEIIFKLRNGSSKDEIMDYVIDNYYMELGIFSLDEIRPNHKFDVTCSGTVPLAIQCFMEADSFEETIRNAISLGGDSDTLAAIAGSIAEAYYKIPPSLIEKAKSFLPEDFIEILDRV